MAEDAKLNQIEDDIRKRLAIYNKRVEKPGILRSKAIAQQRVDQSRLLLTIIEAAQEDIDEGYKPADTSAQLDDIVNECNRTSKLSSNLGGLATAVKNRIKAIRGSNRHYVRAEQSDGWNRKHSVFNVLTRVSGSRQRHSEIDVQFAIQILGADGQYYPSGDDPDLTATIALRDDAGLASCHPTAAGLQAVLGQENGYFATAGGKGRVNRIKAVRLANQALQASTPARVIWLKCTATADGHSFTLVKKPSGRVDVLEAWANPGGNGYLLGLGDDPDDGCLLKYGIRRQDAVTAVNRLNDSDISIRDTGYAALSIAYGSEHPAIHFELFKDIKDPDDPGYPGIHDSDANISILCTVRDLAAFETVQNRMTARYQVISDLKTRLGI